MRAGWTGRASLPDLRRRYGPAATAVSKRGRRSCRPPRLPPWRSRDTRPLDARREPENMSPMPTVLVVDDDPHIRQLLVFALEKAGLTAREAEDGEGALAAVAEAAPDLVVLDINMPKLDGLEVCRRL